MDRLARFSGKRGNFYGSSFIGRRLRRDGIPATDDAVEDSFRLLKYYGFAERCEYTGCYTPSRQGMLYLRRN